MLGLKTEYIVYVSVFCFQILQMDGEGSGSLHHLAAVSEVEQSSNTAPSQHWPQYLVDQHAGEDAHEDPDDGESEHCAEAGVDCPVDDLAVGGGGEDISERGCKEKIFEGFNY